MSVASDTTPASDKRRPTADTPSQAPPFFVVGNDRSGTTMLRLILDRSEEAAVPPESFFLADFERVRQQGQLADHEAASRFLQRVWEHPKVQLWGVAEQPPAMPGGLSHEEAYRFAVSAPYVDYARRHGKSRWGDKTPPYLTHLDELFAVWPDARVIVLVRDGRDVALSIRKLPFGANNVWAAARTWAHGIRVGMRAQRTWPDCVLTVRYEDLVSDPRGKVREICEWCGLTYRDEMLAIQETDSGKIVADQAAWFDKVWSGIDQKSVGKWRRQFDDHQRRVFDTLAGAELGAMKYELSTAELPPAAPPALGSLKYRLHDSALRVVHFVQLRIVQERGRELGYAVRRKLSR